jgi:hypothetical protein
LPVAVAHYRSKIIVDDIDGRQIGALGDLSSLRNHVIDRRPFCDCSRPLGVDVRLAFVSSDAGVGTVVDNVQVLSSSRRRYVAQRKTEELAKVDEVRRVDVGLSDDRDCLASTVNRGASVPERSTL